MFGQQAAWTRLLWNLFGSPDAPPGTEPPPPATLLAGRYRLDGRLGDGGAGVVFRGYDTVIDLPVAIKVFKPDGLFSPEEARAVQADLRAEARASMRLSHPNIARVFTYESDGPWELLVMEFVDGVDLTQLRARQPERLLPTRLVLEIGAAIADALAYAHRAGVVHNDVKPANILIAADGTPKLCDFGLSLLTRPIGERRLTGSPSYMPPERIRGGPGTPAGDQYALAATLFSLATGHAPFGTERGAALRGHLASPMPTDQRLTESLDRVLRRAMAKQPADRYPTLELLRDALRL
ncbi:MAG: serine/threonine-protein kinase, partial [Myxococcota bacterium]